MHFKLLKEGK